MSVVDMNNVKFDNAVEVSAEEYNGTVAAGERNLEVVAAEINVIKSQTAEVINRSIFEIGKRLCEAKAMIGHGNWESWLRDNVAYSETTARTLMRAYREMGNEQVDMLTGEAPADVFESLNLSQMVALFPLPQYERAAFVKEHDVKDMSVREIEALVAEATEKGRQEAADELSQERARADALEGALEKAANSSKTWEKIADEQKKAFDKAKVKSEAELRELREKADRLVKELEAAKNAPVQEKIVYVEKEPSPSPAVTPELALASSLGVREANSALPEGEAVTGADEHTAKLAAELAEVQGKLKEAEQRAAAVAQKADARVQAVNFALREIAGKVADIGGAIDEIENHELVVKLREAATKAIKAMLEGAEWYDRH